MEREWRCQRGGHPRAACKERRAGQARPKCALPNVEQQRRDSALNLAYCTAVAEGTRDGETSDRLNSEKGKMEAGEALMALKNQEELFNVSVAAKNEEMDKLSMLLKVLRQFHHQLVVTSIIALSARWV